MKRIKWSDTKWKSKANIGRNFLHVFINLHIINLWFVDFFFYPQDGNKGYRIMDTSGYSNRETAKIAARKMAQSFIEKG